MRSLLIYGFYSWFSGCVALFLGSLFLEGIVSPNEGNPKLIRGVRNAALLCVVVGVCVLAGWKL